MTRRKNFGELELAVLQVVQRHGRCTVRQVVEGLGERSKYTTVMTVMSRLAAKGDLQRERIARRYEYWPKSHSKTHSLLRRIRAKIFGGKASALVQYLIESEPLPQEELDAIAQMIKEAQKR